MERQNCDAAFPGVRVEANPRSIAELCSSRAQDLTKHGLERHSLAVQSNCKLMTLSVKIDACQAGVGGSGQTMMALAYLSEP